MDDLEDLFHQLRVGLKLFNSAMESGDFKEVTSIFHKINEKIYSKHLAFSTNVAFSNVKQYSNIFIFGELILKSNLKSSIRLPRLIPFPIKAPIYLDDYDVHPEWVDNFLFRLFFSIPLKQIEITVIDPKNLGGSLQDFHSLYKNKHPFKSKILTQSAEIESVLQNHLQYIEDLIQRTFSAETTTWEQYNQINFQKQLPYKVILLFDVPNELSEKSLSILSKLLGHGPKCGVLPIITVDRKKICTQKYKDFFDMLKDLSWENSKIYHLSSMTSSLKNLSFVEMPERMPTFQGKTDLLQQISLQFAQLDKISSSITEVFSDSCDFWKDSSINGIESKIGFSSNNQPVILKLTDNPSHMLLGGKTGSGKSNFLHVMIQSICSKYSPNDVVFYLLDYKEATEFNIYANPLLPHARLVATESDIEYGITVLKHLNDELKQRAYLFKQVNVQKYDDFRQTISTIPMPRIVLIIDEFQKLFEGSFSETEEPEKLMNNLLRMGRAYGIHIVLSTQTIHGLQNKSISAFMSNLGCRVALSCSVEDSYLLLGTGNDAASLLNSPPEGIINCDNGRKTANKQFKIPFAEKKAVLQHLQRLQDESVRKGFVLENKIFNGNILPTHPSAEQYAEQLADKSTAEIWLGTTHDYDAVPFIPNIKGSLLIAGSDSKISTGIRTSVFNSLSCRKNTFSMLYYSADEDSSFSLPDGLSDRSIVKDSAWDGNDLNSFLDRPEEKFIIIDHFDYSRVFRPANLSFKKPGTPDSPYDLLKNAADVTISKHTHVIIFVENYSRFSSLAKELFNLIDQRIGFSLDEKDAGSLISGSMATSFKGLNIPNRAVFADLRKLEHIMFRPFVLPEKNDKSSNKDMPENK